MKKFVAGLLIIISIVLMPASCGKTKTPTEEVTQTPPKSDASSETPTAPATQPVTPSTPADDVTPVASPQPVVPEVAIPDNSELTALWERMDGSTATIPLTAALYDRISGGDWPPVHETTPFAYYRLIYGYADLIFVTYPSENEFDMARAEGVELEIIPVVKDALVFLVNAENPVNDVSLSQLQDIYAGNIVGWGSLGGAREPIIPYQRTADSGSQTLFLKLLMRGLEPMTPPTEWVTESMGALVESVSYYDNAESALGYSMFYYVNNMYGNSRFKLLSVDGVVPSRDTITRGLYPLEDCYYAVMRKDTPADSPLRKLVDWLLTDEGQELAARAGYIPMHPLDNVEPDAIDPIYLGDVYNSSGTGGRFLKSDVDDVVTGGVRRPLSDMFFDGFNYVRYINDEITAYLNRVENEDFRHTWGEKYQIGPFPGIPNNYPNYEISRMGYLTVFFPNGNPFFKPSQYSPESMYFWIPLTEDISPYGEGLPDYSIKYDYGRRLLSYVDLYTLSVNLPNSPAVTAIINAQLKTWADSLPGGGEPVRLLEDFCVWYWCTDEYPYQLQPIVSKWRDYLSVSYILQTYDGPAFYSPMLFSKCFDVNSGRAVDLVEALPRDLDFAHASIMSQLRFDRSPDMGFEQERMREGYVPAPGYIITDAWIIYGRINIAITEPGGRELLVSFWDEID